MKEVTLGLLSMQRVPSAADRSGMKLRVLKQQSAKCSRWIFAFVRVKCGCERVRGVVQARARPN